MLQLIELVFILRTSPPAHSALPFPFKVMMLARPEPFQARTLGVIALIISKLRALSRLGRFKTI